MLKSVGAADTTGSTVYIQNLQLLLLILLPWKQTESAKNGAGCSKLIVRHKKTWVPFFFLFSFFQILIPLN